MSAVAATDLEMIRGDTAQLEVTVTAANVAFDLTGATVTFTAKRRKTDDAIVFEKDLGDGITITNAIQGELAVEIAPADTSALLDEASGLVWDLQVSRGGQVFTVARGNLRVLLDVTR
jgi:hypothetical protein